MIVGLLSMLSASPFSHFRIGVHGHGKSLLCSPERRPLATGSLELVSLRIPRSSFTLHMFYQSCVPSILLVVFLSLPDAESHKSMSSMLHVASETVSGTFKNFDHNKKEAVPGPIFCTMHETKTLPLDTLALLPGLKLSYPKDRPLRCCLRRSQG